MDSYEALKALHEGRKVRHADFLPGVYWTLELGDVMWRGKSRPGKVAAASFYAYMTRQDGSAHQWEDVSA